MEHGFKALALAALLVAPLSTNAAIVYDFKGACSFGCVGFATGVLTLPDSYVPGERLDGNDPITYSFHFDPAWMQGYEDIIDGTLPVKSGSAEIWMDFAAEETWFQTRDNADGRWWEWRLGVDAEEMGLLFHGGAHTWTLREDLNPVPIPAAGWLLLSGLAGLGYLGRRRKTS